MKYIDEYRESDLCRNMGRKIKSLCDRPMTFMEVCGGHTMAIQRFGIPGLLPEEILLLSGPGCPVCVTPVQYIDHAIALARLPGTVITTYGDLLRVPGTHTTLEKEKAAGQDIRIVYSIRNALDISRQNPGLQVVFLGIGFETTAPSSAAGIREADASGLQNFFLLSAHKIMKPALHALIEEGIPIDGYLAPGHVSAITGSGIYRDIPKQYGKCVVISGFEPVDMLQSVLMLVQQVTHREPKVEIQYKRAVPKEGNPIARRLMDEVFTAVDDAWRGLGTLPSSGLQLQEKYSRFDAARHIDVDRFDSREPAGCICGLLMKGVASPHDCPLFGTPCRPENPVGACMVSHEGACQAHYRYQHVY